jgi:hypothetical protein
MEGEKTTLKLLARCMQACALPVLIVGIVSLIEYALALARGLSCRRGASSSPSKPAGFLGVRRRMRPSWCGWPAANLASGAARG